LLEAGKTVGRVKMCSLLRNKYAIELDGINAWTLRMPLFTLHFFGTSKADTDIWVAVGPSKMEWSVLIKRSTSEWPLLAALAFIHVEAWNYG
ncbi:MAG TPA: hypothetical protein VL177_11170, partial [Terriglobales bacterium]|nr:hypothetical protein [Terriglobales bacterium]